MRIRALGVPTFLIVISTLSGIVSCERPNTGITSPVPVTGKRDLASKLRSQQLRPSRYRAQEDPFVQLALEIPETAGFYIDSTHQLVVMVKGPERMGMAVSNLTSKLNSNSLGIPIGQRPTRVVAKMADYDFASLSIWRDIVVDSLLGILPGVVFDDLDEVTNRIHVGVSPGTNTAYVVERLHQLQIPDGAVRFTEENIIPLSGELLTAAAMTPDSLPLGTTVVRGGRIIGIVKNGPAGWGAYGCSEGFAADSGSTRILITAAHCTQHSFSVDGDSLTQGGTYFAFEAGDPVASGSSCGFWPSPPYYACWGWRSSDAASFHLVPGSGVSVPRGAIERLGNRTATYAGSLVVDSVNPPLAVQTYSTYYYTGLVLDKVGRTTGWNYDAVIATCVDRIESPPTNGQIKIYCEGQSSQHVGPGDSGGPVFAYDGLDGAVLYGIVTAEGSGGSPTPMNWTAMGGILTDFGALNVVSEITVGGVTMSGSVSSGLYPNLSWSAAIGSPSGGTVNYRIYRSVWSGSSQAFTEIETYLTTTTSVSSGALGAFSGSATYTGTTPPDPCTYTYAAYYIMSYYRGVYSWSGPIYFRGDADGTPPCA